MTVVSAECWTATYHACLIPRSNSTCTVSIHSLAAWHKLLGSCRRLSVVLEQCWHLHRISVAQGCCDEGAMQTENVDCLVVGVSSLVPEAMELVVQIDEAEADDEGLDSLGAGLEDKREFSEDFLQAKNVKVRSTPCTQTVTTCS